MRIGRAFIIPAVLALGVAGSTLVGSAIPAVASNAPAGLSAGTSMYHHGHKTGLLAGTSMYHHGRKTVLAPGTRMYHHG